MLRMQRPLTRDQPEPMILLRISVFVVVLFQAFSAAVAAAAGTYQTVKYLPGFSGPLPFVLETGYVGVGESEEFQLFHYFVKSYGNLQTDPLILWLTGGPRCSGISVLAFEIGPVNFEGDLNNGSSLPQVVLNPYSWTKKSSIIFVDLPAGTGFSYAKFEENHKSGDYEQVHHALQFLRQWLVDHPEFISNPFYIGGDSWAGMIVPVVAHNILEGNKNIVPFINFQGYILGNPFTTPHSNKNCEVPFAHSVALISNELFELLKTSCGGEYVNIDPNNVECLKHYDTFKKCISAVRSGCILWPKCEALKPKNTFGRRSLYNMVASHKCMEVEYLLSYYWANNDRVRKALHIREGSIGEWIRCKNKTYYNYEFESVYPYHVYLSSKGYRSLIYSGDHDLVVPHMETQAWIKSLNYSIVDDWRPWFIESEVGGYTRSYANSMTFATIKGGGHTAEYSRKECYVIFDRWIVGESL